MFSCQSFLSNSVCVTKWLTLSILSQVSQQVSTWSLLSLSLLSSLQIWSLVSITVYLSNSQPKQSLWNQKPPGLRGVPLVSNSQMRSTSLMMIERPPQMKKKSTRKESNNSSRGLQERQQPLWEVSQKEWYCVLTFSLSNRPQQQ